MAMKITFNGKEYGSLEELPAEVRLLCEQALRKAGSAGSAGSDVHTRVSIESRTFTHPREIPPSRVAAHERVMAGAIQPAPVEPRSARVRFAIAAAVTGAIGLIAIWLSRLAA